MSSKTYLFETAMSNLLGIEPCGVSDKELDSWVAAQDHTTVWGSFAGKTHTEESKKQISESLTGRPTWNKGLKWRWWNNGKINKRGVDCPGEGFIIGRLGISWNSKVTQSKWDKIPEEDRKLSEEHKKKISETKKRGAKAPL